jgi:hypothetical protein
MVLHIFVSVMKRLVRVPGGTNPCQRVRAETCSAYNAMARCGRLLLPRLPVGVLPADSPVGPSNKWGMSPSVTGLAWLADEALLKSIRCTATLSALPSS